MRHTGHKRWSAIGMALSLLASASGTGGLDQDPVAATYAGILFKGSPLRRLLADR